MANETTSSTISELYTEIIAEAMFVANEKSLMRGLVKNYTIAGNLDPKVITVSSMAIGLFASNCRAVRWLLRCLRRSRRS